MQSIERSLPRTRPWLPVLLAIVLAVTVAHLLDWWAHEALANPRLADRDLGRMLRIMGFLPFWILGAIALGLCDAAHHAIQGVRRYARALLLFGAAALGGLAAEVLKILSRRERPDAQIGEYVFRGWTEQPFHTGGLGLASSHAAVAFGATLMLARLFPRARYVWYTLGAGCAWSRVAAGAHFLSDVVVAGALAFVVVEVLWRRFGRVAESVGLAHGADRASRGTASPAKGSAAEPARHPSAPAASRAVSA